MISKLYDWDLRNIAPELAQKRPKNSLFWTFFLDFLKNSSYDSNETFYDLKTLLWSLSTPYKCLICAISSKSYDRDSSESEGKRPEPTHLPHMRLWFTTLHTSQINAVL